MNYLSKLLLYVFCCIHVNLSGANMKRLNVPLSQPYFHQITLVTSQKLVTNTLSQKKF